MTKTTLLAEKVWVCTAGSAILCVFADASAASDWCEAANSAGTYRQCGVCYAVEVWLNR